MVKLGKGESRGELEGREKKRRETYGSGIVWCTVYTM